MRQQNLRRITYICEVTEKARKTSGEIVDLPTGETIVHLADGRSVTYDPIDAVGLGINTLEVGTTIRADIMARGRISGTRGRGR